MLSARNLLILLGLAAALGAALTIWRPFAPRKVTVAKAERGPAVEAVYATGSVEPEIAVTVAPRQTGRLVALNADEGQNVGRGQVLGQLEDTDLKSATAQTSAQEKLARAKYDRIAKLAKKGYATRAALDQAKADWDAAKAATGRNTAQASFYKLIAPHDCLVVRRNGEIGAIIPVNQGVFWLACEGRVRLTVEVDEEDIVRVTPGLLALIRADAFPDKVYRGQVSAVTPMGDPVARSFRVRIVVPENTPLRIGMSAEVNIVVAERPQAMLAPANTVTDNKIWIVRDGLLVRSAVRTGVRSATKIEILDGVTPGDDIVQDSPADLHEGERVEILRAVAQ
jgi:RND family efflux transporter MFP subunit